MTRTLTVSIDDIGLSRCNTDSILASADAGAVTSVSILANGLAFDHAIAELRKRRLRVAVHLNLTEGKPLLPPAIVPHLVDPDGNFRHSSSSLLIASFAPGRAVLASEIRKEYAAQIRKVREALGLQPADPITVDGHQHAHMAPVAFDAVVALASEYRIGSVRIPDEPLNAGAFAPAYLVRNALAVALFTLLIPHARRKATRAGLAAPDAFVGFLASGRMGSGPAAQGLAASVNRSPAVTEILFHTGSACAGELDTWRGDTSWHFRPERERERAYVMNDDARSLFASFRDGTLAPGPDLEKIARYLVSGCAAAATHLGTLFLITEYARIWYVASNVIAFCFGLVVSFTLQKFWTFKDTGLDRVHRQAAAYVVMQVVSLAINTGGLYLLVTYFHMWYLLAEFLLLILVAVGNFFISNHVIFRRHEHS